MGDVLRLGVTFKWVEELRLFDIEVFGGDKFKRLETEVEEQPVDINIFRRSSMSLMFDSMSYIR